MRWQNITSTGKGGTKEVAVLLVKNVAKVVRVHFYVCESLPNVLLGLNDGHALLQQGEGQNEGCRARRLLVQRARGR